MKVWLYYFKAHNKIVWGTEYLKWLVGSRYRNILYNEHIPDRDFSNGNLASESNLPLLNHSSYNSFLVLARAEAGCF